MECQVTKQDKCEIFAIKGDITINTVIDLKDKVIPLFKTERSIILDVTEVSTCDTAGFQLLSSICKTAKKANKEIEFKGISDNLKKEAEGIGVNLDII